MERVPKAVVTVLPYGIKVDARKNEPLAAVLERAGILLNTACGRKGVCGKCLVEVRAGRLSPLHEQEFRLFEKKKLERNQRLACLVRVGGNLTVGIPATSLVRETKILDSGPALKTALDPAVKKFFIDSVPADLASPVSFIDSLRAALKNSRLGVPLGLLAGLGDFLAGSGHGITAVVHRDREIIGLEPGDTRDALRGIAVDLGTTTLVVELVDLNTGKTVGVRTALNSQLKHGADVISRLASAYSSRENGEDLRRLVVDTLNDLIGGLLEKSGTAPESVYEIALAGNTAMNHLLLGIPVSSLAVSPFQAVFSCLEELRAAELGFMIHPQGKVYLAPNIRSFVGGDISAGLIASGLEDKKGNYLFVDLGTNGEIVLKTGGLWMATSTAAGPAFEGMNISCGLPAIAGAVASAGGRDELKLRTIGGLPPAGVCGTGLIDLVAFFLKRRELTVQGKILSPEGRLRITPGLALTQDDIRQIQLACAAVKSGMRLMLKEAGLAASDLDGLYIAGAFGRELNIRNTQAIGLLPRMDCDKVVFIGNSSLAGARLVLLNRGARNRVEALASRIRYLSLAKNPLFQEQFIEALEFGIWP